MTRRGFCLSAAEGRDDGAQGRPSSLRARFLIPGPVATDPGILKRFVAVGAADSGSDSPPAQVAAELALWALALPDLIVLIARKIQKADRLFLGEAQLATQLGRVSGVGTAQPDLYRARIDVGVPI